MKIYNLFAKDNLQPSTIVDAVNSSEPIDCDIAPASTAAHKAKTYALECTPLDLSGLKGRKCSLRAMKRDPELEKVCSSIIVDQRNVIMASRLVEIGEQDPDPGPILAIVGSGHVDGLANELQKQGYQRLQLPSEVSVSTAMRLTASPFQLMFSPIPDSERVRIQWSNGLFKGPACHQEDYSRNQLNLWLNSSQPAHRKCLACEKAMHELADSHFNQNVAADLQYSELASIRHELCFSLDTLLKKIK